MLKIRKIKDNIGKNLPFLNASLSEHTPMVKSSNMNDLLQLSITTKPKRKLTHEKQSVEKKYL